MRRWSRSVVVVALVLVGAACGGSGEEVANAGSADEPEDQSFEDIEFESPLADFLGQDVGRFQFDEAAAMQQQREAESLIATCMAEAGFEYIPRDPSETMSFGGPPGSDLEPGSNAWIAKYGFGMSTQRFPQSMVGDLVGIDDELMSGPGRDIEDPNQEYVESLSEGEREAYFEALHGEPPDFGPGDTPDEDFVFEPTGCQFEGFRNGPGGPGADNVRDFYQAFGDEVQAMQERVEADSRIVAFNSGVSSCVAERGMEWTSMREVFELFEPRLNKLQSNTMRAGDPLEAAGLDREDMSEREIRDFYMEANRLSPEALVTLAEIQADEIALAQAVIECGGGPIKEQQVRNEVRVEYERAFLEDNADELADYAG